MKPTKNLLLTGIMLVSCCAIGNAQVSYTNALSGGTLIYSNAFNGQSVTVHKTPPTFAQSILGGSSSATWNSVTNNGTMYLNQDGTIGLTLGTSLLPFNPQYGYVYTLSASVSLPAMSAGKWINMGFAANDPTNVTAARFGDSNITGNPWMYITEGSGGEEFFPTRTLNIGGAINLTPAPNVYTVNVVLDATGGTNMFGTTNWVSCAFVNGGQVSTNYAYSPNPTVTACGLGQTTLTSSSSIIWSYMTLSATPLVITRQPISAGVGLNANFTNTVAVAAKAPCYQWYTNGVPLVNGGNISGATNAALILSPVTAANAGTDYYCIITNSLGGSNTSAAVSLTVYGAPIITSASPVTYSNVITGGMPASGMTLYGGTNVLGTNYPGSTPAFSASALGVLPLHYQWLTNGVAVGGATINAFAFTNCPLNGPTNFSLVVNNIGGSVTNTWLVSYAQSPLATFPQTVLSNNPVGFWRLNEGGDDGNGNNGVLALDYAGGNNGIYSNAVFGYAGYSAADPTVGSVRFDYTGSTPSYVYGIQGIDFSNYPTATFSVQAWIKGAVSQTSGSGIISKGYNGGEQFALDINNNQYRFTVRDASGNAYSVTSAHGPDNNWHFVVGVCDEANGVVSIYVDGLVDAASVPIASGAGVYPCLTPVTIGARGSSPIIDNDLQFVGFLSDVAVYGSALNAGQVALLWEAAGNPLGLTFIPPMPLTNEVYLTGKTLTIPAIVFGMNPIGYYWTNLTSGGIISSGSTNVFGNLNASLIISNAPASLSGQQWELVVTNATLSTNFFTLLFSPAPPVQVDYSSPILYSNYFDGGTWSIWGMPLTAENVLVGGTNTMWTDVAGTYDTGSLEGSGVDNYKGQDSWVLPFTPHPGYIYTLTASVVFYGNPGSWVGMGFAQTVSSNSTTPRFSDSPTTGYNWMILSDATGNLQWFAGPAGVPTQGLTNQNNFFPAGAGTNVIEIDLDTTGTKWVEYGFVNGVPAGTNIPASNPAIGAVGITQTTQGAPNNVQWQYWSLSQVVAGGVPPYLLAPLPPTNTITLTNATVAIPATAYGSGPLGYYWINNSTIVASGLTNNMAPLQASLNVPSSSLKGGPLELVVTNAYGTNTTLISLVSIFTENTNAGPIQVSVTGNQLALGWPTNLGWTLQVQTNNLSAGLGTNWVNVPNSTAITNVLVPMSPTNGSVFYRLHF